MGWFVRQIVKGEKIKIFGDGKQSRDLNFVDDVVDALLTVGDNDKTYGEVFNLGSDNPVSLKNLVELMIAITGKGSYELVTFPEEKKKIDIGSVYLNFNKIKKITGWSPKISLEDGLKATFKFYEKYGAHYW
jgi:nucleoside-diphosphate-sugar epimerase